MSFVTRDSGKRVTMGKTGMVRDSSDGKPRFDLLFAEGIPYEDQFLLRWAALMARGAVKYGERNHELGEYPDAYWRAKDSAARHFVQWLTGASDEEDHAAAVCFNIMLAENCMVKFRMKQDGLTT